MLRSVYSPHLIMAEEEPTKKPVLYGSAGMAASGMMPGLRQKKSGKEESPPSEEETTEEVKETQSEAIAEEPAAVSDDSPTSADTAIEVEAPADEQTELTAAVVGHTGSGDFGSHLDMVFQNLEGVKFLAVSDSNVETVDESRQRTGALEGYSDFRKMLEKESPSLVSIATRWSDSHFDMARAALEADAHLLCEKPFTRTLKEADELVALAEERNRKIAIAHPMRCDPHVMRFKEEQPKLIGNILEMHLFGKMDRSAGGEDLLLQGEQLFDLVRFFAGEPSYCTATITQEGVPAIAEDSHKSENIEIGPLLGDCVRAQFMMESGAFVSFVSDQKLRGVSGPWGIEFVGEKGRMRLFANQPPIFSRLASSSPRSHTRSDVWQLWPQMKGPYHSPVEKLTQLDAANRLLVQDWIEAIEQDREPRSSGRDGLKSLEMVHGVWQAAITMKRAYFPLVNRLHPLIEE